MEEVQEVEEQNDDDMIVFVVDDDALHYEVKREIKEEIELFYEESKAKLEHEDMIYCTEDANETLVHQELIEDGVRPDIGELNEEYTFSEDDLFEVEFIGDDDDIQKIETNSLQKNRAPRTSRHEYFIDEQDILDHRKTGPKNTKRKNVAPPKSNKKAYIPSTKPKRSQKPKRKPKDVQKNVKKAKTINEETSVIDDEVFYEVEFLDDDKVDYVDIYNDNVIHHDKSKKIKKKTPRKEKDEEFVPSEIIFSEDEYQPEKTKRKSNIRRSEKRLVERPIKSFIAELRKKDPLFKHNEEKLMEYLVEYWRKRRPPTPPSDCITIDNDKNYICSYCDMEKPTLPAALRHYQAAHGPRYLECLACGSGFRSTVILYKHEKRCPAPDATLQLRARGLFLGRKGRGLRPYLTQNKFVPKEPPPRATPRPVHVPWKEKPRFHCEQCPQYFSRQDLLDEHMHKHTGYRAFQCPDCPAAYVSRYQLTKHSKRHSDAQFICDHCGMVFKLKTTLSSHMYTHLPRPRFGCGRCGRRYAKRDAVRSHIMRDHLQLPPPAPCPVCPKRYNRMSAVKLHMKKEHGLTLMTQRSIALSLPYMKLEDLDGAKVVFDTNDEDLPREQLQQETPSLKTKHNPEVEKYVLGV